MTFLRNISKLCRILKKFHGGFQNAVQVKTNSQAQNIKWVKQKTSTSKGVKAYKKVKNGLKY